MKSLETKARTSHLLIVYAYAIFCRIIFGRSRCTYSQPCCRTSDETYLEVRRKYRLCSDPDSLLVLWYEPWVTSRSNSLIHSLVVQYSIPLQGIGAEYANDILFFEKYCVVYSTDKLDIHFSQNVQCHIVSMYQKIIMRTVIGAF